MELTREEQAAFDGERGESLELAYRILVATGESMNAKKLVPIKWAHISGVNYNTIGDAGEEFLSKISKTAHVNVMTTINPTGFDTDRVTDYGLDEKFIKKQESINNSYKKIGAIQSFSCIPYEIYDIPKENTQVSFAESNAAIHANSVDNLKTNKESAISALASSITGKSILSDIRSPDQDIPDVSIHVEIDEQNELLCGILGYFAGKIANTIVNISGLNKLNTSCTKSLCSGLGTSGQCIKYVLNKEYSNIEKIHFNKRDFQDIYDELNTCDKCDLIALGSPQLGIHEISNLVYMLKNKIFKKPCMIFCPRSVKKESNRLGYTKKLQLAGCEINSDCCMCFTPLLTNKNLDFVTTNSIKGAYYLNRFNKLRTNLKSLRQILNDYTR